MSYRLIDSNAIADKYPEVNDMPCVFADLQNGLDGSFIDVQPVVRCKDCKHWKDKTDTDGYRVWCTELAEYMRMDEYCSRGERKDDER